LCTVYVIVVAYAVHIKESSPVSKPAATRTRRPRGSLTPALILDAAEYLAEPGLDRLSVRAVAAELEAAPMSLYRHFATMDELLTALLNRVLGRFQADPPTNDWSEDLRRFARAHKKVLDQHPWAVPALFTHPNPGSNAVRIGEAAFEILARAGFSEERAVATFSGVIALNYGWSSFTAAAAIDEEADYGSERHYELMLDQLVVGIRGTRD
jgi:AcrR family transcriptional regulator